MSACVSFVGILFYEWLPAGRAVLPAGMLWAVSGFLLRFDPSRC